MYILILINLFCMSLVSGIIGDGRLTVGITKFDQHYLNSKRKRRGAITVEMVKERVVNNIEEATGAVIPDDMIIPICGEWALDGSRLNNCLISDPKTELSERYEEAAKVLHQYPELSLPGGQGQTYSEIVCQQYPPLDLVEMIESISGITDLKARYN